MSCHEKDSELIQKQVQEYYGTSLQSSADLKTDACTMTGPLPPRLTRCLNKIHDEVVSKFYGCGLVVPQDDLTGLTALDLGCGSGRDCYILSQLVGESGSVFGIDMTEAQLDVAQRHQDYHRQAFGYEKSNTAFLLGRLEQLDQIPLLRPHFGQIDLVVSNCVLNLCVDKQAVLCHAFAALREGGEFYFSDVYSDRRVPQALRDDPLLYGECLGGALYWNDFIYTAKKAGFLDPRLVTSRPLAIGDRKLAQKLDGIKFYSATYRLFKIARLEHACEEYGQAVRYRGPEKEWALDAGHVFQRGLITTVCGNTALMLQLPRFESLFDHFGDFSTHHGLFPAGKYTPFAENPVLSQQSSNSCGSSGGCC